MGKIGAYQPSDKNKNYLLPTSKPITSHPFFYKQKVWTPQEQVHQKLKKIAEYLESLYPKLTDENTMHIKSLIAKNIETLIEDLDKMNSVWKKNPYSFDTNKLKTNQNCIIEMKNVCDKLQRISAYGSEHKKLAKIRHALHELDLLIQPTSTETEKIVEKASAKPKIRKKAAKKALIPAKPLKKKKAKSVVSSKKPKTASKKAKPAKKSIKRVKTVHKVLKKTKTTAHKPKKSVKKVAKPKSK